MQLLRVTSFAAANKGINFKVQNLQLPDSQMTSQDFAPRKPFCVYYTVFVSSDFDKPPLLQT